MTIYKSLSQETLNWLMYPKLTIKQSLWAELSELHYQLQDTHAYPESIASKMLDALDNFFTETGQGGVGRHSDGRDLDLTVLEIDCIPAMQEMVCAAPYFGKFPTDEVPVPSTHPALHASVAVLLTYRLWRSTMPLGA